MEFLEEEAARLIKATYVSQGLNNLRTRRNTLKTLLHHRKLPRDGYDDAMIEFVLSELATMDSNNFSSNAGVGEREGRVFSGLVSRRHFNMSHGIGRSGDIAEVQPKAAGSSIMYKVATSLTLHALQIGGSKQRHCLLLPLATGMSLNLCLLNFRKRRPAADIVIFPRIDQKSCFKSILTAGLTPVVVDNAMNADDGSIDTNLDGITRCLEEYAGRVLCVLSTTSCFAPRQPDSVDEIARLCQEKDVFHLINNAYGTQCGLITKLINRADVVGRVDAVVQSTDKNFMVPVGGAIVTSSSAEFISGLSAMYPGRANSAPIMDLFVTLLAMGESTYRELLEKRNALFQKMMSGLEPIATKYGEKLIVSPKNTISIAVSLAELDRREDEAKAKAAAAGGAGADEGAETKGKQKQVGATFLGSMLFQRSVSGCRVVARSSKVTRIEASEFSGWGSHMTAYPCSYFTAACAIGQTEEDVALFLERLDKVMHKVYTTSV